MIVLKKKDVVYYARILDSAGIFDVLELKIRTVEDNWFVGVEKRDNQAFLFYNSSINKEIFIDRDDALRTVQEAEKNKKYVYEEVKNNDDIS